MTTIHSRRLALGQTQKVNPVAIQKSSYLKKDREKKWLPVLVAGVFFISLWKIPVMPNLTWYMALGMAFFAFIALKQPLNTQAAKIFIPIYGLSLLGAIVSLLRATDLSLALWNTVGAGISLLTFLLFLPVFALPHARRFFLFLLILSGLIWAIQVQLLIDRYGQLFFGTFGLIGQDKNYIGMILVLAGTALLYLAFFWKPEKTSFFLLFLLRLGMILMAVFFFYSVAIIYARSGVLAAILGVCILAGIKLIASPSWINRSQTLIIVGLVTVLALFLVPNVLLISPQWQRFENFETEGLGVVSTYNIRSVLLNKGLYIIRQNPILGVGIGGSRFAVSEGLVYYPHYLIHNTFLTDWAEKGFLGLLSNFVWIWFYVKLVRKYFFSVALADQIWLVLFSLVFFEMLFLDMGIGVAMQVILAGIYASKSEAI
jgi:O-antigen ligase